MDCQKTGAGRGGRAWEHPELPRLLRTELMNQKKCPTWARWRFFFFFLFKGKTSERGALQFLAASFQGNDPALPL